MKRIIITGAGGMLGTELIFTLADKKDIEIVALTTHKASICERFSKFKSIKIFEIDELERLNDIYGCIHCAFSRSSNPLELASSLKYTAKLIKILKDKEIKRFINISSQSVYGEIHSPLWKESLQPSPDSLYAMAKFSSELITESLLEKSKRPYSNVRLASINMNARFVNTFVKNAISGKPINIIGGKQKVSFLDVRDAANALIKMLFSGNIQWKPVYNLGTGLQNSIIDFAKAAIELCPKYGLSPVELVIKQDDSINLNVGMNNSSFCEDFSWKPKFNYINMIESVFNIHLARTREKEKKNKWMYPVSFLYQKW